MPGARDVICCTYPNLTFVSNQATGFYYEQCRRKTLLKRHSLVPDLADFEQPAARSDVGLLYLVGSSDDRGSHRPSNAVVVCLAEPPECLLVCQWLIPLMSAVDVGGIELDERCWCSWFSFACKVSILV